MNNYTVHDIALNEGGKYRPIQPMHLDNLKKMPSFPQNTDLRNCLHHEFPIMKYLMELNHYLFIFIHALYNT